MYSNVVGYLPTALYHRPCMTFPFYNREVWQYCDSCEVFVYFFQKELDKGTLYKSTVRLNHGNTEKQ